jgi:cysteine desulfurase
MTELRSEEYVVNGHKIDVVTSILNLSFPGIDSHTLITLLDLKGIAISGGSACAAGSLGTSKVMEALGLAPEIVKSSIRISFGITNTLEEVREATREMLNIVKSRR